LEHGVALANMIDVPTQGSGQAAGIRITSGSPENSILFQAFSGESSNQEVQLMPPIGVALRDSATVELLRNWITSLP
jgi:hypothetical protein